MISNCSRCGNPCIYGKRAIEILSGNNSDVPLCDGKKIKEKAKEENMLRRKEQADKKVSKDNRAYINDWYNKAMASEDPVKWVMDAYNIDKTKAKAKLYQWKRRHGERKGEIKQEVKTVMPIPENIETKLERLYKEKELISSFTSMNLNLTAYPALYKGLYTINIISFVNEEITIKLKT